MKSLAYTLTVLALIAGITLAAAPLNSNALSHSVSSSRGNEGSREITNNPASLINSIGSLLDEIKQRISTAYPSISTYIQGDSQTATLSGSGSGLVAHYTFDEGSGTTANDSASSNHGTINGATWTTGKVGSGALDFDGVDDLVAITGSSVAEGLSRTTITFWHNGGQLGEEILGRYGNTARHFDVEIYTFSNDRYVARWRYGGTRKFGEQINHTSASIGEDFTNGWHFVALVYDDPSSRIYHNGELLSSTDGNGGALNSDVSGELLTIGGANGKYFTGTIDDVRIYNRVLSKGEIGELYALGGAVAEESESDEDAESSGDSSGSESNDSSGGDSDTIANTSGDWYVDSNASGSNNGVSWTDAWRELDQINWSVIESGDTIYISGGTGSKKYKTPLIIEKDGTQDAPITITTGLHAPVESSQHDGRVILDNTYIHTRDKDWITIEGRKNPDKKYTKISDLASVDPYGPVKLRDNLNFEIRRPDGTCVIMGYNVSQRPPAIGQKIFGLDIHHCGEPLPPADEQQTEAQIDAKSNSFGIWARNISKDVEIAYNHIHHATFDGINLNPGVVIAPGDSVRYGIWSIHHNVIEKNRDDGFQGSSTGLDFHHNFVRSTWFPYTRGHADGLQTLGDHVRIYSNVIGDMLNAGIYPDLKGDCEGKDMVTYEGYIIYNNIIYQSAWADPYVLYHRGLQFTFSDNPNPSCSNSTPGVTMKDVLVANNTFIGLTTNAALSGMNEDPRPGVDNVDYQNTVVSNNLFYDNWHNYWGDNKFLQDNNLYYASPGVNCVKTGSGSVTCGESTPSNAIIGDPKFVDTDSWNLNLQAGSTAIDIGSVPPASLLVLMPDKTDLNGNSRNHGLSWDAGAFEYTGSDQTNQTDTSANLLLHYDFEDDWSDGVLEDKTNNNINASCQLSLALDNETFNQCPNKAVGPDGSDAAEFYGSTCDRDGDYFAIPSDSLFKNMEKGSLSLWAFYDKDAYGGSQLIDTWDYQGGTWGLGRDWTARTSQRATRFMVAPENVTSRGDYLLLFPDNYIFSWNHYAVTWDGDEVKGYFNGSLFDTVDQPSNLTTNDFYLALGAFTHYKPRNYPDNNCVNQYNFPSGSYVFPNNGFLIGKLDDVRIYDDALSSGEIASLAGIGSNIVEGRCGTVVNTCSSGALNDITDSTTHLLWECEGFNGGNTASCSLEKNSSTSSGQTIQGDLNSDGVVNSLDWSIMRPLWNTSDSTADINEDGIVNSLDFSILNRNWST